MRLINTTKIELVDANEEARYAILSHRWEEEEVTLQEIQELSRRQWSKAVSHTANAIRAKKGYIKLKSFAALALREGYEYIWVDTCCIDKTSSAELSEAINSMYRWYRKADKCYAYLSDVKHGYHDKIGGVFYLLCSESRWFTRGWTLQELVAPAKLSFYGADWKYLGSKNDDEDIQFDLKKITGINIRVLDGSLQIFDVSVAERMKWASKRETSRPEDLAYSLLGIFDANMPLLYGEGGAKAFIRLQEEILRSSNDHTIFAWRLPHENSKKKEFHGLLAPYPRCFDGVESFRPLPPVVSQMSTVWATTNQGMHLSLFLQPASSRSDNEYVAILESFRRRGDDTHWSPGLRVQRLYGDQFARVQASVIEDVPTPSFEQQSGAGTYETCFFKQNPTLPVPDFIISFDNLEHHSVPNSLPQVSEVYPPKSWDSESGTIRANVSNSQQLTSIVRFSSVLGGYVDLALGLQRHPRGVWSPWILQQSVLGAKSLPSQFACLKPFMDQDGLEGIAHLSGWYPSSERLPVQFRIHKQMVHGRIYFLIKAWTVNELSDDGIESLSSLYNVKIKEASLLNFPVDLQHLLGHFMTRCSLDSGYLNTSLSMVKSVRIARGHSMGKLLEWTLKKVHIVGHNDEQTRFLRFCEEGHHQTISSFLDGNAALKDSVSISPFELGAVHWAAIGGHIRVIGELLRRGVEYDSLTPQGWTTMHLAALFGRFQALNWLIRYKFSGLVSEALEQRDNPLLETPLHLALSQVLATEDNEELNALEELIGKVENSGVLSLQNYLSETPMHRLAASGLNERARRKGLGTILTHEKKCHYPGKYIDHLGRTLLWHATCSGRVEEVRLLLETLPKEENTGVVANNTITVNQSDNFGISPLHVACRFGYTEVARTLLKAGAWPNCVTSDPGFSPAHYTALFNHAGCLEVLIEYGADVCRPTVSMEFICTPMHLATVNNFSTVHDILVAAGSSQYDLACTHHIINNDQATGHIEGTGNSNAVVTEAFLQLALFKIPAKTDLPQT
ncbi:uncharacterized protein PG986_002288 [Apiospora aurea]|uniref:Heterokaryon incompatibility domain-containing protein n=1 Tax=Apiospora aurea TaxID=335848 RepID=A0ABR1R059_9PEZI